MTGSLNETETKIYELARPYLAIRNNDNHTSKAVDFTLRLLETGRGDRDIAVPAAILHDVGWSRVPEDIMLKAWGPEKDDNLTRIHEREGVKIAAGILKQAGYDGARLAGILQIISEHDTGQGATSVNDEIVKDADKLTRYTEDFWFIVESFSYEPMDFYRRMQDFARHWFFLPLSREIAEEELRKRWREIAAKAS